MVAITFVGIISTIASLGMPGVLVRRVARQPSIARSDASAALSLYVSVYVLVACSALVSVRLLSVRLVRDELLLLVFMGSAFQIGNGVLFSVLNGQGRYLLFSWLNAVTTLTSAIITLGVLVAGGDVVAFASAGMVVAVAMSLVNWRVSGVGLQVSAMNWTHWRIVASEGLPFLGMSLTLRVRGEFDRVILSALASAAAVGWYSAAGRIMQLPIFIPTLVTTPLLPTLSQHVDDRLQFHRTLERSICTVLVLTIPVCVILLTLAPDVPALFHWGVGFQESIPLMMILSVQQPLVGLDMVLGTALVALNRERKWLLMLVGGSCFNCIANGFLIAFFEDVAANGAIGAAVVSVLTELLLLAAAVSLLPNGILSWKIAKTLFGTLVASLGLGIAALALLRYSIFVAIPVSGVIYLGLVMLFGVLRASDVSAVLQRAVKRPS